MKSFLIIFFILIILSLFFVFKINFNNNNNNNMNLNNNSNEVAEYKTFICQNFDFTFKFPDFKDWEYKYTENRRENLCIMYFNYPDNIRYEVPPKVEIHIIQKEEGKDTSTLSKNPQNIPYQHIQDPSIYVDNHKFEEGDWDWLVFYGKDFNVKIERAMFGEIPFDANLFYKKIIETFNFK